MVSTFLSSLFLLLLNPLGGTCVIYLFLQECVLLSDKPQIQTWCSSPGVTICKVDFWFSSDPQPAFTFINTARWNIDFVSCSCTCRACKCAGANAAWVKASEAHRVPGFHPVGQQWCLHACLLLAELFIPRWPGSELDLTWIRPGSDPDLTRSGLCALNMIEIHSASPSDENFNFYSESRNRSGVMSSTLVW